MCSGHSAPLADIEHWIKTYFNLRLTDGEIVEHLIEHYDTDKYSLGCVYQCRHQIQGPIVVYTVLFRPSVQLM